MSTYTVEVGLIDAEGRWSSGTYSADFEAQNLSQAKQEVDRRSENSELFAYDRGSALRVYGPDGSAQRKFKEAHEDAAWS